MLTTSIFSQLPSKLEVRQDTLPRTAVVGTMHCKLSRTQERPVKQALVPDLFCCHRGEAPGMRCTFCALVQCLSWLLSKSSTS